MRGAYKSENPLVEYKKSEIPGAGNGIFACVNLKKDDCVTTLSGSIHNSAPCDREYAMEISPGVFFIGIRSPIVGEGLGSFINKEIRASGSKTRKNCICVRHRGTQLLVIKVIKKVKKGCELYMTYSHGYRIKRK